MNIQDPVSQIMSKDLITLNPKDKLTKVENIFSTKSIHHIPVVEYKSLVGIISKSDFLFFQRGTSHGKIKEKLLEDMRYKNYEVNEIMTTGIASLKSSDKISVAINIFKENLFHCIPILEDKELVGILTPMDIIKNL